MRDIEAIKRIGQIIADSDDIVISAHIGPDGDAIGSVSALLLMLKKMGKQVSAVLDTFPEKFRQVPGAEMIKTEMGKADCKTFISLDCGDKQRLGRFAESFDKAPKSINIDHHVSNDFFGQENYVDGDASATAEIIYTLTEACPAFALDAEVATALYVGLMYDTGGFRHPSTTSYTYMAAAKLIDCGVNFSQVFKDFFYTRRFEETQIFARALENIRRGCGGKLAWTSITTAELRQAGARLSELDDVVNYVKSIAGCKIAVFYYEKGDGEFKASFRSEPGYDVSKLAIQFGGGGHKNAAGSSFFCSLDSAIAQVSAAVEKVLLDGESV